LLSVPSLDLPCVVVGRGGAGELDSLAVQSGVSEQVAEVLKQLQQLVRGVLEDRQNLGGHHVVHDEERRLRGSKEVVKVCRKKTKHLVFYCSNVFFNQNCRRRRKRADYDNLSILFFAQI